MRPVRRKPVDACARAMPQRPVLDALSEAIFFIDEATLEIRDCNVAARKMFGYTPEELRQRPLSSLTNGQLDSCPIRIALQAPPGTDHESVWLPTQFCHKEGHRLSVEITAPPNPASRDPDEERVVLVRSKNIPEATICSVIANTPPNTDSQSSVCLNSPASPGDVPEIIPRVLWKNPELFQLLCENAPIGIFLADRQTNSLYANHKVLELTGLSAEEAAGHGWQSILHPEDREATLAAIAESERTGQGLTHTYRIISKNGQLHWVTLQTTWLQSADEQPRSCIGLIQDVTPNKRIFEALKESEARFRAVAKSLPIPFGVSRKSDGRILYANPLLAAAFGHIHEEFLGLTAKEYYVDPADRRQLIEDLERDGQLNNREIRWRKKDGTPFWTLLSVRQTTLNGEAVIIGGFIDITEQKQGERLAQIEKELSLALSASYHISEALERVLDAALQIDGIDAGGVYLVDPQTGELHLRAHRHLSSTFVTQVSHYEADRPETITMRQGQPLYWSQGDQYLHIEALQQEQIRALAAIPLTHDGQLIAVWNLASKSLDEIPGKLRGRLENMAHHLGSALARILARKALADSEQLFRNISTSALDAMVLINNEGQVTFWNPAAERIFGYTPTEVMNTNLHELLMPPAQIEAYREGFARFQATGDGPVLGQILEIKAIRKNGEEFPAELSVAPLRWRGRWHAIGIIRDITKIREAEKDLRRKEKRHADILRTALDGFWIADTRGRLLEVNDAYCKLTGYCREELLSLSITDLEALESPEDTARRIEKIMREGTDQFETRHRGKDGRILDLEINTQYSPEFGGYFYVFIHDITSRKQAENELRKFKTIADYAPHGTVILNPQGYVLYANNSWAQMHGYQPAELIGHHISIFHFWKERDIVKLLLASTVAGQGANNQKIWHRRRDGSSFPTLLSYTPIRDNSGQVQFLTAMAIDISQTYRAEEEKAALQAQLIQAQKLEAIGTLASGVAHDFSNLLSAIFGYAELAKATLPGGHPAAESLAMMEASAKQARGVINSLLTFTRRGAPENVTVDLRQVLRDTLAWLCPILPSKIRVIQEAPATTLWIKADPTQIQQLIVNLAINARDAMPTGGDMRFTLQCVPWPSEDDPAAPFNAGREACQLIVEDNGLGMPEEIRAHAFEPFFTTKPAGGGSGLGLSIVHSIVTAHHGIITLESALGSGTQVRVCFPASAPPPPTNRLAALTVGRKVEGQQEKVYILQSEAQLRSILLSAIRSTNFRPEAVSSMDDLQAKLAKNGDPIHIAVVDWDSLQDAERAVLIILLKKTDPGSGWVILAGNQILPVELEKTIAHHSKACSLLRKPLLVAALQEEIAEICERFRNR